jgi:hypothetical protein
MDAALAHHSWASSRHSNFMETQHDNRELAHAYDESVRKEREAWHALHAHPPGTAGRERAWQAWSQAIVRTNHAWRKLSASRITRPGFRAAAPQRHANA